MNIIMILSVVMTCALAAPTSYTGQAHTSPNFVTGALRHVNQLNDDGSYTFGYENADGSFRMENRDINGLVQGRYGFVDPNGDRHEFDYVAGSVGGQSVGFQSRNGLVPLTTGSQWPVIRTASHSTSQRVQDFEYSSVDDNHDGIPDHLGNTRLTSVVGPQTEGSQVFNVAPMTTTNTQNVIRVVEAAPVAIQTPISVGAYTTDDVRLAVQKPTPINNNFQLTSMPLRQQSVIRTQPTSFVIQEQQPTLISSGGQIGGGFIRNVHQPTFSNIIRNTNTFGGQRLRGGVRYVNTLLGNTGY